MGTVLDEKELDTLVSTVQMNKNMLPAEFINEMDQLKGKTLTRTLKTGNNFTPGDIGADQYDKLPEGMVKVSLKMDGVRSVQGFVKPGDHVDIVLTENLPNGRTKAGYILRNMLLVAVDTTSLRTDRRDGQQQVSSVSLAATSTESLILMAAQRRGEVSLTLRDKDAKPDHKDDQLSPVTVLPGFDKPDSAQPTPEVQETKVKVWVAKKAVPLNLELTEESLKEYFEQKEVHESDAPVKRVDKAENFFKQFVVKELDESQSLTQGCLSENRKEDKAPAVVQAPPKPQVETYEMWIEGRRVVYLKQKDGSWRASDLVEQDSAASTEEAPKKEAPKKDSKPVEPREPVA